MRSESARLGTDETRQSLLAQRDYLQKEVIRLTAEANDVSRVGKCGASESQRDLLLKKRLFAQIDDALRHFHVIELATDASQVWPGTIVTYKRSDEDEKSPRTVQIGDYGSTDSKAKPPIESYDSNILLLHMLGRRVGEEIDVKLRNGKDISIEILDIRLPSETSVRLVA